MAYTSLINPGFDPFGGIKGYKPTPMNPPAPTASIPPQSGAAPAFNFSGMMSSPAPTPVGPAQPSVPAPASPSGVNTSTPTVSSSGGIPSPFDFKSAFGVPTAQAQTVPPTAAPTATDVGLARPNAQAGDPWYGVKQADIDSNPTLSTFLDSFSGKQADPTGDMGGGGLSSSSTGQPFTGYGVSVPGTTNSNVVGSGMTYSDVLNARNQLMTDYQNAQKQYASDYQNITGQEIKGQFAGDTQDYGTGMANLIRMEGTPVLTADQMRAQSSLNALQSQQSFAQNLNPFQNQVSPGSTAFDPSTGQPIAAGMGAAPSQIMSTAQQFASLAQQQGTLQYNQDGSVNMQPYIQQAQQYYGSGFGGGGSMGGMGGMSGMGGGQSGSPSGSPQGAFGSQGYGNIQSLPAPLQKYAIQGEVGGQKASFILASRVPDAAKPSIQSAASAAGIPYLDQDGANSLYAAEQILGVVDAAKALSIRNLGSGTAGRISDTLKNWANNYLQFNPDLSNFAQLKDAASKATTALAGGVGSGFRMNMGIIEAATQNLPTANDNLETALSKADALGTQILNGLTPVFPQLGQGSKYGNLLQSQYSGSSGGNIDWSNLQ